MLQRVRDCAARAGIVLPELTTGRDQQAPVAQ
jgi:hypothetical protein